jgi:YHYH protein
VPLGDGYVSTTPKVGYVDSCVTSFGGIGGAMVDGPWIDTSAKTWDETTKLAVNGVVKWPAASYRVTVSGGRRLIVFNDLPDHSTGVFPIASSDPAYAYDRNGNHIAAQSVSWSLPASPKPAAKRACTGGGPIGVLGDGAFLYNALDGEGRDAAAHEVLDSCAGHPDPSDSYHHHDIPPCLLDKSPRGKSTLVGYALDGYGIYVVQDAKGNLPTNVSLDACHGTTSVVPWNGKPTRIYHYVATLEYPYTVGCYHGTPISSGHGGGGGGLPGPPGPPGAPGG